MKKLFSLLFFLSSIVCSAQTEINPSSDVYSFNIKPFNALYSQMGSTLLVSTSQSADKKIYNISMSMADLANPSRVITDVIGLSTQDGSFVYRDFHLPMPSWTFNRVQYTDAKVAIESFSRSGSQKSEKESPERVFDGTFVYWQLSGIDQSIPSFKVNRWKYTPQGLVVGIPEAAFELQKKEDVSVDGNMYACRVYSIEAAPGVKVICYVSDEAPYLIKQEYRQGDGEPTTILSLYKMLN